MMPLTRRRLPTLLAALMLAVASAASAQIWVGGGFGGRFGRMGPRWPNAGDFDGQFLYCRGYFNQVRGEGGGQGWRTDYPGADNNLSVRLRELTMIPVKFDRDGRPHHIVVQLTDPLLSRCATLFMEDVGTLEFTQAEVKALRDFFLKGGFLWVDDYWGTYAWQNWVNEISRVLPPGEFPIFDIPMSHPLLHALYDVKGIPQVPNIGFWRSTGGDTSERGADSARVNFRGIQDSHGRLMVVMSHNTDIADTWEREGENRDYFDRFSPAGYAIGVNVVLYSLTH